MVGWCLNKGRVNCAADDNRVKETPQTKTERADAYKKLLYYMFPMEGYSYEIKLPKCFIFQ